MNAAYPLAPILHSKDTPANSGGMPRHVRGRGFSAGTIKHEGRGGGGGNARASARVSPFTRDVFDVKRAIAARIGALAEKAQARHLGIGV